MWSLWNLQSYLPPLQNSCLDPKIFTISYSITPATTGMYLALHNVRAILQNSSRLWPFRSRWIYYKLQSPWLSSSSCLLGKRPVTLLQALTCYPCSNLCTKFHYMILKRLSNSSHSCLNRASVSVSLLFLSSLHPCPCPYSPQHKLYKTLILMRLMQLFRIISYPYEIRVIHRMANTSCTQGAIKPPPACPSGR